MSASATVTDREICNFDELWFTAIILLLGTLLKPLMEIHGMSRRNKTPSYAYLPTSKGFY